LPEATGPALPSSRGATRRVRGRRKLAAFHGGPRAARAASVRVQVKSTRNA